MKKIFTLLIGIMLYLMPALSQQDSVTSLIFTEWYGRAPFDMYFELTNMGDSTLHLENFRVSFVPGWGEWIDWSGPIPEITSNEPDLWGTRLSGTLDPGETMVFNNVMDSPGGDGPNEGWRRWSWNRPEFLNAKHHFPIHYPEAGEYEFWDRPDLEMWGKDSVDAYNWLGWAWNGGGATVLWYLYPDGSDSVLVDQVNLAKSASSNQLTGPNDVAGISAASNDHILVRKSTITKGNTNWDQARGVDMSDSEWIPIFSYDGGLQGLSRQRAYTTVGTHGNFSIDLKSETIGINDAQNILTVPWGILKHDSILDEFEIGPGMAWFYIEDTIDFADSAFSTVQTGDKLRIYACGDDLEIKAYSIEVSEPTADMALVFPKRRMRYDAMKEKDFNKQYWGGEPYYVTEDVPGIDSIGGVPFGTRADSLIKYLEMAPKATWEIVWVDGMQRVDLKEGDKLVVTAENGTTKKEYYIGILDYEANDNALLSAITWPDKNDFLEGWSGDTIPNFTPATEQYQVILPYGTRSVPAFRAITQDLNAKITEDRATNLSGSQAERTTTFTVTAEDDSTTLVYAVIFKVEKPPENIQYYQAEPIISEMMTGKRDYYEFANVGDLPIDMSHYLFGWTSTGQSPAQVIQSINIDPLPSGMAWRYSKGYVPGYKFTDDTTEWAVSPGKLYMDNAVNPVVEPGDVFVMGNPIPTQWVKRVAIAQCDVITNFGAEWLTKLNENFNTWKITNLANNLQMGQHWTVLYLFRIENDSILDGLKQVNEDPADYTLIDAVGDPSSTNWMKIVIGDHMKAPSLTWNDYMTFRREPFVYKGNTALDSISRVDEWMSNAATDPGWNSDKVVAFLGSHGSNPVTVHLSTVTSTLYSVSDGYSGAQMIQSAFGGATVEGFYGNISKADAGQTFSVINGTNGSVKELTEVVATGDTLMVESTDGKNVTKYYLLDQALDDDAVITPTNSPSNIVIETNGETGLIKGVKYGDILAEIMDSLQFPAKANASIIDQNGALVSLNILDFDTVKVNTLIGDKIYIEVVAQNGVNKITYKFEPAALSSDAFVVSSMYHVDQGTKIITKIADGTSIPTLWKYTEVVRGGSAMVIDKYGFERSSGSVAYDDRIKVVSQDGSKTVIYYLQFLGQPEPAVNQAPVVTLAQSDFAIKTNNPTINVSATVTDDGLPLPAAVSYLWEVVEGDASKVSIATADAMASDVTFSAIGSYKLKFTADDGELSDMAEVTVSVTSPTNTAPVVGVSFPSASVVINTALKVTATATDDGFPAPPGAMTYKWSVKTGDAAKVTIANDNQLETNVTISALGSYVLEFSADDGEIASKKTIAITVTVGVGVAGVPEPAVKMYPNPAKERVNLELLNIGEGTATVRIFNLTGKSVYTIETTESKMEIDISGLDAGVYFVAVSAGENHVIQKLNILR